MLVDENIDEITEATAAIVAAICSGVERVAEFIELNGGNQRVVGESIGDD